MNNWYDKLRHLEQLTLTIIQRPNDPLYTVIDQGPGIKQVFPSHLATTITESVRTIVFEVQDRFPSHEFHPNVDVFIRHVTSDLYALCGSIIQHDALKKQDDLYRVGVDYEIILNVMISMHACVDQIRQAVQKSEFIKHIENFHRISQQTHAGLMNYIDALVEQHRQLWVVGFAMGYRIRFDHLYQVDITKQYWWAKYDFERWMARISQHKAFNRVMGAMYKLEFDPINGYQYVIILFFESSGDEDDQWLGSEMGFAWEPHSAEVEGRFDLFNANQTLSDSCGLGRVDSIDLAKRGLLKQAVSRLNRLDEYAYLHAPDDIRTVDYGNLAGIRRPRRG